MRDLSSNCYVCFDTKPVQFRLRRGTSRGDKRGELRIVEAAAAILGCLIAGAFGFYVGGRLAPGPILGAIMGAAAGVVVAAAYFALGLWVGETWPNILHPRRVGLAAAALLLGGMICGAIGSWFGYRKSLGAKLF